MKPKRVSYELIDRKTDVGKPMYELLQVLIDAHHEDIKRARIALAWHSGWKADVDGRVQLGQAKKTSDLDKEFAAFDFIILLNRQYWVYDATPQQKRALLDHELMHCAPVLDKHGEPKEDERGRKVYRLRKHDLEEFAQIVERHGLYKGDLERMAAAMRQAKQGRLALEGERLEGTRAGHVRRDRGRHRPPDQHRLRADGGAASA